MRLDELRAVLLHADTSWAARDDTWRHLLWRARRDPGEGWGLALVWMAAPGLRVAAGRLTGDPAERVEVHNDLVTGFLAAVQRIDIRDDRLCARLCNAAHTHARAELSRRARETPAASGELELLTESAAPPDDAGCADDVLDRAVDRWVLAPWESDLIGGTYLEDVTIAEYAAAKNWPEPATAMGRHRAKARLLAALDEGRLHRWAIPARRDGLPLPPRAPRN
jgi:hypothetical protein